MPLQLNFSDNRVLGFIVQNKSDFGSRRTCLWTCACELYSFQLLSKVTLSTDLSSSAYENESPEWYMTPALKYNELTCRGIVISSES